MIKAINISSKIKFKEIIKNLTYNKTYQSNSEIVYKLGDKNYIVLYSFGVYVLINISYKDEFDFKYCLKTLIEGIDDTNEITENYDIEITPNCDVQIEHNKCILNDFKLEYIRIISLVLAQSVALNFFENNTNEILSKSLEYSKMLKNSGRYPKKQKQLLKFIGFALSVRQEILSNLYVLDTPEEAWNNSELEKIFIKMKEMFDIEPRFKALNMSLNSIQESVEVIVNLLQAKKSNTLEILIILLIFVEIILSLFKMV